MKELSNFKGKKVLVTGHTGFKGSWLCIWLLELGAEVIGIALDPDEDNLNGVFNLSGLSDKLKDYRVDIRDKSKVYEIIENEKPEIVFHLAAQPLVRESYDNPHYTYEVNTLGTVTILEAMRLSESLNIGIFITTDKVYQNKEWIWPYRETESLGGYDPYSSSKAAAELVISSYRDSFFNVDSFDKHGKSISSVRAGNVIGGGDWSKNRIVPDCINYLSEDEEIEVRNPSAVRPWQHVIEPLGGYMLLAAKMIVDPLKFSSSWNFGPEKENIVNVGELVKKIIEKYGTGSWKDGSDANAVHEAQLLSLDINKSKYLLGWEPVLSFDETIQFTLDWYKSYDNVDVYDYSLNQIKEYQRLWKLRKEN